jgi:hypothetical protein
LTPGTGVKGYINTNNKNNEINEGKINKQIIKKNSAPLREHMFTLHYIILAIYPV